MIPCSVFAPLFSFSLLQLSGCPVSGVEAGKGNGDEEKKEDAEDVVILAEVAMTKSDEMAKRCYQEMIKSLILQSVSSYYVNKFDCKALYKKYRKNITDYNMQCFCRYSILISRLIFMTSLGINLSLSKLYD